MVSADCFYTLAESMIAGLSWWLILGLSMTELSFKMLIEAGLLRGAAEVVPVVGLGGGGLRWRRSGSGCGFVNVGSSR